MLMFGATGMANSVRMSPRAPITAVYRPDLTVMSGSLACLVDTDWFAIPRASLITSRRALLPTVVGRPLTNSEVTVNSAVGLVKTAISAQREQSHWESQRKVARAATGGRMPAVSAPHPEAAATEPEAPFRTLDPRFIALASSLFLTAMGANAFVQFAAPYLIAVRGWSTMEATVALIVAFALMPATRVAYTFIA